MRVVRTIAEMRAAWRDLKGRAPGPEQALGFVPTMGALHAGHLSLVRAARATSDVVAVSIFVNPAQFGPNEDFAKYPRAFEADCALLELEGVEIVFAPDTAEMYPEGATTRVHVGSLRERLDGASRPGHFDGVATVVAKLLHIVEPRRAFFGQKDAAQVAVLRAMVRDLNIPVELVVCPTVREPDGLALSSRNRYLSVEARGQALVLSRALREIEARATGGETRADVLLAAGRRVLAAEPGVRVDYLALVDPDTLEPVEFVGDRSLVAVAAEVSGTRLIDNVLLSGATHRAEAPETPG